MSRFERDFKIQEYVGYVVVTHELIDIRNESEQMVEGFVPLSWCQHVLGTKPPRYQTLQYLPHLPDELTEPWRVNIGEKMAERMEWEERLIFSHFAVGGLGFRYIPDIDLARKHLEVAKEYKTFQPHNIYITEDLINSEARIDPFASQWPRPSQHF
jgi:hypothetical protein